MIVWDNGTTSNATATWGGNGGLNTMCTACGRSCNCGRPTNIFYVYRSPRTLFDDDDEPASPYEPPYLGEFTSPVWTPIKRQAKPPRMLASYPHYRRYARRESRRPIMIDKDTL